MNKNILIGVGAVAVVAAIGAFVFLGGSSHDHDMGGIWPGSGEYSLRDLLEANADMRCTFSYDDGDVRSSGTVYTAQNVIRVDSESTTTFNNLTVKASSIIDPEYVYTWMEGSSDGYRIAFADMETYAHGDTGTSTAPDYDRRHSYDCEDWDVEEERFQTPSDVTFIDPMEMLKGIVPAAGGQGAASGSAEADVMLQMCGLCEQAGDPDAISQCKAALGCG